VCGTDERPSQLVCCESCPAVYHVACAGLGALPAGEWFCSDCTKALTLENVERILDVRVIGAEEAAAAASAAEAEAALRAAAEAAAGGDGAAAAPLPRQRAAAAAAPADGPKEYYIKWKERSYLHCSWVAADMFERAIRLGLVYMRTRLRKFHGERDAAAAALAAMAAEDEDGATGMPIVDEGLIHGVHPAWLQVGARR
jgi:chromodomain-helicase-DNA-binding protein 4